MKFFFVLGMAGLLCFKINFARPLQSNNSGLNNQLRTGAEYLYNLEMEKAEKIFRQAVQDNPRDPLCYYYLSQLYLWNYLGNSSKAEYNKFIQYSDLVIKNASAIVNVKEKEEFASLLLGNIYTQRAIAFGRADNYLDMIWASQKAKSYLNDVLKINKNNYDAYLGLGLYKFALTQVPSSFKWALKVIGFEGDLKESIQDIRLSATKGSLIKAEANYYLAQILCDQTQDYDNSLAIYSELQKKYPGNFLFSYSYSVALIKARRPDNAIPQLQKLIKTIKEPFKQVKAYSFFLLGDIRFHENKFKEAKVMYESFIASTTDKNYTGIANYRLALCIAALKDFNAAKPYFEKAKTGNQSLEDDAFADSKATYFLKHSLYNEELVLIAYGNMIEDGKAKTSIDSLTRFYSYVKTHRLAQECRYLLSEALYVTGNFKDALKYAFEVEKNSSENTEKWVLAYSHFNAARAFLKLGSYNQAKEEIKKIESLTDYEYAQKLQILVNSLKFLYNLS